MNAFGRVVAVILSAILIILFPIQYIAANQEEILNSHVHAVTNKLADEVMLQGFLTTEMYNNFLFELDTANQLYDIELIHSKSKEGYETGSIDHSSNQVDTLVTSMDSIKRNCNGFQKTSFTTEEDKVSYDVEGNPIRAKKIDKPQGFTTLSLSKHTGEFKTAEKNNTKNSISLMSTHVHTDDCYAGHRHNSNCNGTLYVSYDYSKSSRLYNIFIYNKDGILMFRFTYDRSESWYSYDVYNSSGNWESSIGYNQGNGNVTAPNYNIYLYYITMKMYCDNLYKKVNGIDNSSNTSFYYNVYYTDFLADITVIIGSNSWIVDTPEVRQMASQLPDQFRLKTSSICPLPEDTTPICNQVVTSITANSPYQAVYKGDGIDTTATATYLDGHTGTVYCSSSYTGAVGTETVYLTYYGLVYHAKTTGDITCTATVATKAKNIPASLTITPSSYTVYNGSEPTYTVQVNYNDSTSRIISSGYTKTGFTIGAGTKTVVFTYAENGVTVSASVEILVKRNTRTCINGHTYELDDYDNDDGCPYCEMIIKSISAAPEYIKVSRGSALPITVTATYMDEHTETVTGWTSNYKSDQLGNQLVTVTYQGKITYISVTVTSKLICPVCGTEYNPNPDGSNPGCPVCSKFIESITATPATQVVSFGEELKLQVEATFRNGNHAYVNDWSSDFNPFKIGTQNVTVIYGTVSTTVTAIVKSASQTTCPICGTTYNPIIYPNGCPICSNLITGITAKLKNGGTKVQFGSELDLAIILAYRDGHRVVTYNGWSVSGYQPYVLGYQNITVTYKEFRTTLAIEVVNTQSKKVCPNGHVYYLNEDGTDPGCPYCSDSKESNYSQNYKDCIYTDIILEVLYSTGIYYFNDGDGFTITVTQRPGSILGKLQNMFTQTTDADIKYSYGGIVHG